MLSAMMVFLMAIIGAITRLEEAGLSITEWNVLTGIVPPLSHAAWETEFVKYQATPEYRLRNFGMELADFQYIFFWEWIHRLWGRLIGLVFGLPLIVFWLKGFVPARLRWPLAGLLVLGGLQGFIGWYMVQSGLVDRPDVSHYRLATHLFMAVIIYSCLTWLYLRVRPRQTIPPVKPTFCLLRHGWLALLLVYVTLIWGAFVAGLDAGKIYNTWPLMGGHFVPAELEGADLKAYVDSHAGVQFVHRWLAMFTALFTLAFAWRAKARWVAGMVFVQVGLGVVTLLTVVAVPVAALHQAGALALITLLLAALYPLQRDYQAASCARCAVKDMPVTVA